MSNIPTFPKLTAIILKPPNTESSIVRPREPNGTSNPKNSKRMEHQTNFLAIKYSIPYEKICSSSIEMNKLFLTYLNKIWIIATFDPPFPASFCFQHLISNLDWFSTFKTQLFYCVLLTTQKIGKIDCFDRPMSLTRRYQSNKCVISCTRSNKAKF